MTHNVRYQGWRSVESSCNPPMWPQSCTQSLLAFWSVGVALLTKQPEDSVNEIDAAWVQVRNRRRVGFSAGAPHFPFLQNQHFDIPVYLQTIIHKRFPLTVCTKKLDCTTTEMKYTNCNDLDASLIRPGTYENF